jgi:hypothetical protein
MTSLLPAPWTAAPPAPIAPGSRRLALGFLAVLLALSLGCATRNKPSQEGTDVEAAALVSAHPEIDHRIRYVKHQVERTPDGRFAITVVLESSAEDDLSVIGTTDWFAADGRHLERGDSLNFLIARGGTYVYKDSAFHPEAAKFHLALRPASTKRKR